MTAERVAAAADIALSKGRTYLLASCAAVAGFAIPVSTAGLNIAAVLLVLCVVCMAPLRREIWRQAGTPLSRASLFLYGLLIIGTLWSSAGWASRLDMLERMYPYLVMPLLLVAMSVPTPRKALLCGFIFGGALSAILSIASAATGILLFHAQPGDYAIFRTHTYHNLFIVWIVLGVSSVLLREKPSNRILVLVSVAALCLLVFDAMFLVRGRSAQLLFLGTLGVLLIQEYGYRRTVLPLLMGLTVLLPTAYFGSPQIRANIDSIVTDLEQYREGVAPGDAGGRESSVGLRIEFVLNTVRIISTSPLVGHGTGSFRDQYEALTGFTKKKDGARASHNPHNDYLWLWAEIGPLGAAGLLAILAAAVLQARRELPVAQQRIVFTICLSMGVGTLGNSFFTDNTTGVGYALLISALLAGPFFRAKWSPP